MVDVVAPGTATAMTTAAVATVEAVGTTMAAATVRAATTTVIVATAVTATTTAVVSTAMPPRVTTATPAVATTAAAAEATTTAPRRPLEALPVATKPRRRAQTPMAAVVAGPTTTVVVTMPATRGRECR